ncbi:MAG: ABC transporter ATP-binding protein [Bacteroidales bacterium]
MNNGVEINGISKRYTKVEALKDVSLMAEPGRITGLLGPDGAGKTTLFRILTTLLLPDSGTAHIAGMHVVDDYKLVRANLGYMPQRFSLYQDLSVEENLRFFATIFNTTVEENYEMIAPVYDQIAPFSKRLAGRLSGGMKQKLALSCALIHKPEVLILDEPTTGVDAVSRKEFWQMLQYLKSTGLTILVSTPYMDEAQQCDEVALIQDGEIMVKDTPQGIINQFEDPLWRVKGNEMYRLLKTLEAMPEIATVFPFGEYAHITFYSTPPTPAQLQHKLEQKGIANPDCAPISPDIEDCFMALMKKQGNETR